MNKSKKSFLPEFRVNSGLFLYTGSVVNSMLTFGLKCGNL